MREIKFRVWSKSYKGFIKQRMDFMHLSNAIVEPINDGDLIWLQCTGLKDKNGVEIYEGDRVWVKWNSSGNEMERSGIVKYNAPSFTIEMEVYQDGLTSFDFNYFTSIEVIGNIYENEELLKGN